MLVDFPMNPDFALEDDQFNSVMKRRLRKHSFTGAGLCHHRHNSPNRKLLIFILLLYFHHPIQYLCKLLELSTFGLFQCTPHNNGVPAFHTSAFYSASHLQQRTNNYIHLHKINFVLTDTKINTLEDINEIERLNIVGLSTTRDDIQQNLVSPAPESFHVLDYGIQKFGEFMFEKCNEHDDADFQIIVRMDRCRALIQDIQALCKVLVKPGISIDLNIVLLKDTSSSIKEITWTTRVAPDSKRDRCLRLTRCQIMDESLIVDLMKPLQDDGIVYSKLCHQMTCLEISHEILKNSIKKSNRGLPLHDQEYDEYIKQLEVSFVLKCFKYFLLLSHDRIIIRKE